MLENHCISLSVVGVVELVGLITWLCIATGQHSSFCGCAVDFVLGGFDHVEDGDHDRGGEENGQKVETFGREEEVKAKRDNARSDTW